MQLVPPGVSTQQGAALPFDPQDGTAESTKPPRPFEVWLTTVQSGSCVPGLLATGWVMHGGCSVSLMSFAMRSSDGPKSAAQIGSRTPLGRTG